VVNRGTFRLVDIARAFKLDAGDGEHLHFSNAEFLIRASADTTAGAFSIIEEIGPLDTPLHIHEHEDELFYVLEGEHIFVVGDAEFPAARGAVVFGPRGVPHAHRRREPRAGRFLTMCSPAGFEGFFRELDAAEQSGTIGPAAYAAASERYGVTWL
jgi:mannose-6-phosphate isomerase-like protein (cupin superfamily)